MGYLKENYNIQMLGEAPEGTCPECAVVHNPEMPHNKDSLTYQYKFYDKNGNKLYYQDKIFAGTETLALVVIGKMGLVFVVNRNGTKNIKSTSI